MIREYGLAGRRPRIAAPRRIAMGTKARRFTRFGLVGLSGVVINMALLYLLVGAAHMQHLVAATLATEAAIVSNFAWNDRWTFHDALGDRTWLARLCRYNAVSLSGLGISLLVIAVLTERANMYYLMANLVAIAAATVWNYAVNARLTWRLPAPGFAPMKAHLDADLSRSDPAAMGED